jgi:acetolactate decarboxylase
MRRLGCLIVCALLSCALSGSAQPSPDHDVLFQTSTIDALLAGVYDGTMSLQQLKQHGDFGLGTFHALDGEMVAVDGTFYQIAADGVAHRVDDEMLTPFAAVTFFEQDEKRSVKEELDLAALTEYLDELLPSQNVFYAIRIDGTFKYVKTRSVPRQEKPYQKLVDVVAHQPTFEFADVKGTIAGFWCPYFVKSVNVPGYHLHFIDEQRTRGGHVLGCRLQNVTISLDITPAFFLSLPPSPKFRGGSFDARGEKDLEKVEKDRE